VMVVELLFHQQIWQKCVNPSSGPSPVSPMATPSSSTTLLLKEEKEEEEYIPSPSLLLVAL